MGFGEVYDYVAGKVDWFGAGLPGEGDATAVTRIAALVDADVPTCAMEDEVGDVGDRLGPDGDVCLVVNESKVVLGLVQGDDLGGDDKRSVGDVMQEGPSTVRPNVPAAVLASQAEDAFPWLVVTTPEGELVGILRGADLQAWAEAEGQDEVAALHEDHDHD